MSNLTIIYRTTVVYALTVFGVFLAFILFIFNYLKNPFSNPWAQKLRLVPPACLTDPKYGVHKYLKVNGIKLHYVENGDSSKPLMLLIHGFPEFWYSWRHQIIEFSKDYWCIAVDMRGFGDSERAEILSAYDLNVLVEDVRDLVRQLGRDKCILVAHDWGGVIACRFRDVHPDATSALIMLSSTSKEAWNHLFWTTWNQMLRSWYIYFFQVPSLPELFLQTNDMDFFDRAMMVKGKERPDKQDIECYKYWFGKPSAFKCPINYYRANITVMVDKKFKEEKVPMLVANAANDLYLSPGLLDCMKTEYAHIETTIVPDCGHFLQQEEPEKVNLIIREFLDKHDIK